MSESDIFRQGWPLYSLLVGVCMYMLIAALFGRRPRCSRWVAVVSNLGLILGFGMLAYSTVTRPLSDVQRIMTRFGFALFLVGQLWMIGRQFVESWRERRRGDDDV